MKKIRLIVGFSFLITTVSLPAYGFSYSSFVHNSSGDLIRVIRHLLNLEDPADKEQTVEYKKNLKKTRAEYRESYPEKKDKKKCLSFNSHG